MAIVARRKANGVGLKPRHALPWALVALCVCAAAWLALRLAAAARPQGEREGSAAVQGDAARAEPEMPGEVSADATPPAPQGGNGVGTPSPPAPSEEPRMPRDVSRGAAPTASADANGVGNPSPPAPPEEPGKPPPIFDNPVEEQLESVSRDGFDSIVALRVNLSREEVLEILRQPVEIYDDDDEETVAAKERTAEMKAAALDYIEAGGTFNQFLRDCQAEANEARETVKDVREEMKRILETEGEEAARAYLDAQNPLLRAQGLEEVHIGKGLLRMAERHRESAAAGER